MNMVDEYIRKADAIKQCGFGMTSLHIADNLRKMRPADVVPVIRCRDCKNRDEEDGFCTGRGWPCQLVPDDGFCDKGKKK